jgi:hypothetical protein
MTFKRGDQVFYKCSNPMAGRILRLAKNGSWADVRWDAGIKNQFVRRTKTSNLVNLGPVLNQIASSPFVRALIFKEDMGSK